MEDKTLDDALDAWPFVPGQSPFRAKGRLFLGQREFIHRAVPGSEAAVLARLRPTSRHCYEQGFLDSGWYDVALLIELGMVCAKLTGRSYEDYIHFRAADQLARDMRGMYGFLAKLVTPSGAAVRMARGMAVFVNFAEVRPQDRTATRLVLELEGIPRRLVYPWFAEVLTGYAQGLTEHVRASSVEATLDRLGVMGQQHGMDVLRARLIMEYG